MPTVIGRNSLPTATVYTATWMTLINNVGPREPDTQSTYCRIPFVQFKEKTQAQLRMLSDVRSVVTFGKVINGRKHTGVLGARNVLFLELGTGYKGVLFIKLQ